MQDERKLSPDAAGTAQNPTGSTIPARPLDARVVLARFLDAIESRDGVGRADVDLARSAILAWKRQQEAVRLLEKLLAEIQDDGPTDVTFYAAKREAES